MKKTRNTQPAARCRHRIGAGPRHAVPPTNAGAVEVDHPTFLTEFLALYPGKLGFTVRTTMTNSSPEGGSVVLCALPRDVGTRDRCREKSQRPVTIDQMRFFFPVIAVGLATKPRLQLRRGGRPATVISVSDTEQNRTAPFLSIPRGLNFN